MSEKQQPTADDRTGPYSGDDGALENERAETAVLAVYSIEPDFLAVWLEECQDLSSDGLNGQHRGCLCYTDTGRYGPSAVASELGRGLVGPGLRW